MTVSELTPPTRSASLEAWATEAFRRRMALHLQRTSPIQIEREQAFTLMSALVAEAIEMVRAVAKEREGAGK
jgi:NTP pyrophosphatase (non-canonical NTP hydrolase)